jgi:GAF domain-containing protein
MEPVPHTVEALRVMADAGEAEFGTVLWEMATRVRRIVPDLVGLSVGIVEDQVTLTLVASTDELAGLDAVQYADDGPCVAAATDWEPLETNIDDLMDEDRWQAFAQASAALGIASSLSLPIPNEGRAVGSVNLYAATPYAFDGHVDELAAAVGTSAEHAIRNADLSFRTLQEAAQAPQRVQERHDLDIAIGIIAERHQVDTAEARRRIQEAAARAGITEVQAARVFRYVGGP